MRRFFSIILFVFFLIAADGCRSQREAQRIARSDLSLETVLEARLLDSVCLSESFSHNVIFEFYPPTTDSVCHIAIQEGSESPTIHGAVRRVTVETRKDATATRIVVDSVAEHREISESDFKSVETSRETDNPLPLAIGIAALLLAACAFLLYRRK